MLQIKRRKQINAVQVVLGQNAIPLTLICLFIVMIKSTIKYMTKMGQNTGMLKNSKNVHAMAITTALVAPYLKKKTEKGDLTLLT